MWDYGITLNRTLYGWRYLCFAGWLTGRTHWRTDILHDAAQPQASDNSPRAFFLYKFLHQIKERFLWAFLCPICRIFKWEWQLYVEPDISVICNKGKLADKGCFGAPDWIIEIVSAASKRMDYYTKLFEYRTAGVREYWIVDSKKNHILVYNFESEYTDDYTFSDSVKAGIYDDLYINFSNIAKLLNI